MKIVLIVIVRYNSKRLPGKALINVKGKPLLWYIINKALKIKGIDDIVIATSSKKDDDKIVSFARKENINFFRGDLNNVALRVLNCAIEYQADYFIRLNGDSPYFDYKLIKDNIKYCYDNYDLITNLLNRTFPYGISVEIIKTNTFMNIYENLSVEEKEHITKYFYKNRAKFAIKSIYLSNKNLSGYRLVVDTPADLLLFRKIINKTKNNFVNVKYKKLIDLTKK